MRAVASAAAAAERRRENIAALKAELSNIENVAPLHKAGDDSNNNLGNNYGNRVGAPRRRGARDHREAYNAAVQRVKLPLISGNGAVPQHHGRPRAVPGGGEYAPAETSRADAPPRRRRTKRQSWADENRGISSGIRAERAAAAAVLARAGLVPAQRDRDRHGAARAWMYHGGMGAAGVHGVAAGVARRVRSERSPRGALQRGAVQLRGKLRPKQAGQTTRADGEELLFLSEGRRVGAGRRRAR